MKRAESAKHFIVIVLIISNIFSRMRKHYQNFYLLDFLLSNYFSVLYEVAMSILPLNLCELHFPNEHTLWLSSTEKVDTEKRSINDKLLIKYSSIQ